MVKNKFVDFLIMTNISLRWLEWQFFDESKNILAAWKNFLRFGVNYFSLPLLLKTLFSPWRKYSMSYGRRLDFNRYFEAFTFNLFSRFMGAILRISLIFIGLLVEGFIFLTGLIIFLGWLVLPFLLIAGLLWSLKLLI